MHGNIGGLQVGLQRMKKSLKGAEIKKLLQCQSTAELTKEQLQINPLSKLSYQLIAKVLIPITQDTDNIGSCCKI